MQVPSSSAIEGPHSAQPAGPGRTLFAVTAVLLCALLVLPAQAQSVFTVSGVPVDVTADTAAQARTRALAEGQQRAFDRLLARLTMPEDRNRLPGLDSETLTSLVQGIEIEGERTSPVRYLASLTVRFQAEGVRQILRDAQVPYADTSAPPQVVVPIYRSPATPTLWDDPNPWRDAWARGAPEEGLIPIIVPYGELADISTLTAEQALAGDRARLRALAARYNASEALVAEAVLHLDPRGIVPSLDVRAGYYREDGYDEIFADRITGGTVDDMQATLGRAVAAVRAAVDEPWKRDHLIMSGPEQRLEAEVPFASLEEWVQVRQRLDATAAVTRSEVLSLGRSGARLRLHFMGSTEQLQRSLGQRDLALVSAGGMPGAGMPGAGMPGGAPGGAVGPLPGTGGPGIGDPGPAGMQSGEWRLELVANRGIAPAAPAATGGPGDVPVDEPLQLDGTGPGGAPGSGALPSL